MAASARPVRICHVGGQEFLIYRKFDETVGVHYLTYPDFAEHPQYTGDGRPFTRSDYVDCPHYKATDPKNPSGQCDDCCWFCREETPLDVIGLCLYEGLRRGTADSSTKNNDLL